VPGARSTSGAGAHDTLGPLGALLEDPSRSAVLTDFDGTLAPIVSDPERAEPVADAPAVLGALSERFGVVAVVSGRPVSFLAARLTAAGPGVRLFGVYGMEWIEDGVVHSAPEVEAWRGRAAEVVAAAESEFARTTVGIEDKGASVTVHWRGAPGEGERVIEFARQWSARTGLSVVEGRMAREFRPPEGSDKGTVVELVASGCVAACFVGDDTGDLAAFAALDRLAANGTKTVRVAVTDEESPPELVAAADVVVRGPVEAVALLGGLATSAPARE
jgi:trehalose 6-phosphate phosphatase